MAKENNGYVSCFGSRAVPIAIGTRPIEVKGSWVKIQFEV